MVAGVVLALGLLATAFFFRDDIKQTLNSFKGFGSNFGSVNLPDININVPELPKLPEVDLTPIFEGIPKVFSDAGESIGKVGAQAQSNFDKNIAGIQKGIDIGITQAQSNFEQNITGIQKGIGETGKGITDFFGSIFPPASAQSEIEKTDGSPVTIPTNVTPTTIERQAGRRTFGGQSTPKMTLTKQQASTPQESKVIISKQPNLELVSPFLKTSQVIEGEQKNSRFSGSGSRR